MGKEKRKKREKNSKPTSPSLMSEQNVGGRKKRKGEEQGHVGWTTWKGVDEGGGKREGSKSNIKIPSVIAVRGIVRKRKGEVNPPSSFLLFQLK